MPSNTTFRKKNRQLKLELAVGVTIVVALFLPLKIVGPNTAVFGIKLIVQSQLLQERIRWTSHCRGLEYIG